MRNPACSLGNTPSRHCPLSHAVREHTRGRHGTAASSKGDVTKMRGGAGGARASQRRSSSLRMSAFDLCRYLPLHELNSSSTPQAVQPVP